MLNQSGGPATAPNYGMGGYLNSNPYVNASLDSLLNGGSAASAVGSGTQGDDALAWQTAVANSGRLISSPNFNAGGRDYFVDFGGSVPPVQLPRAQANEIETGIGGLGDQIDPSRLWGELGGLHHDFNSSDPSQTAVPRTPAAAGYTGSGVSGEYVAEAIRAYLSDPGYVQTMAPNTAAAIQNALAANPEIADSLRANAVMPFLTGGGSAGSPGYDWPTASGYGVAAGS
jgi:hypothetical protein